PPAKRAPDTRSRGPHSLQTAATVPAEGALLSRLVTEDVTEQVRAPRLPEQEVSDIYTPPIRDIFRDSRQRRSGRDYCPGMRSAAGGAGTGPAGARRSTPTRPPAAAGRSP